MHTHQALFDALWQRHTSELTFQEIRRSVAALSATYVKKREQLGRHARMTRGKRAAFALSFAPRHLVLVEHITAKLAAANALRLGQEKLYDLGCGSGVGGAAWALAARQSGAQVPKVVGIDTDAWALGEARWLYATLDIVGRTERASIEHAALSPPGAVIAAFALNELDVAVRESMWQRLLKLNASGMQVLIVEPIARGIAPFVESWAKEAEARGARTDAWRLVASLGERMDLLSRAARLDHRELTARSLFLPAPPRSVSS